MIRESRIVAELLLADLTVAGWDRAIKIDNRLQKRSPATASRVARAVSQRLLPMGPEFWRTLRDGDEELATQAVFCSVLERNLLLVEFMESVVRDSFRAHAEKLELYQWDDYLEECANRDPVIHDWTPSSKKKMGQIVFRILAEMGYLKDTKSRRLQRVIIRPEVREMLEDSHMHRTNSCLRLST